MIHNFEVFGMTFCKDGNDTKLCVQSQYDTGKCEIVSIKSVSESDPM